MNASQIRTTQGNVGNWAHSTVSEMLKRREYMGDVTINGEVVAQATFEAIIDRKTFARANREQLKQPAEWRSLPESGLLTGLLICGVCGAKMKRGRGRTSNRLYGCLSHESTRGGRTFVSVSADYEVVEAVRAKARQLRSEGSTNTLLSAQAAAIEHEITEAQRRHSRGELTLTARDAVVHHLRSRLAEERTRPSAPSPEGDEPEVWSRWNLDTQRQWLSHVAQQVVVGRTTRAAHGPHVESGRLTVHFKDGEVRTLTRSEVTLEDVGRLAGCARDTAGRALKGTGEMRPELRARVRAAADDLGYDLSRMRNAVLGS